MEIRRVPWRIRNARWVPGYSESIVDRSRRRQEGRRSDDPLEPKRNRRRCKTAAPITLQDESAGPAIEIPRPESFAFQRRASDTVDRVGNALRNTLRRVYASANRLYKLYPVISFTNDIVPNSRYSTRFVYTAIGRDISKANPLDGV